VKKIDNGKNWMDGFTIQSRYACPDCGFIFYELDSTWLALRRSRFFICPRCDARYSLQEFFELHRDKNLNTADLSNEEKQP
jgi:uncharacterized C2H2 Zn-finger protein